jgi:hypothetical protein
MANLQSYRWRQHCNGLFQTPAAAWLQFDTDTLELPLGEAEQIIIWAPQ